MCKNFFVYKYITVVTFFSSHDVHQIKDRLDLVEAHLNRFSQTVNNQETLINV